MIKKYIFTMGEKDSLDTWEETYEKDLKNPAEYGQQVIDDFNASLRPGEKPRRYVSFRVLGDIGYAHDWVKRTNGMSVNFNGVTADLMFCRKCNISGKKFGLSSEVKLDSKYKAKKHKFCSE